MVLATLPWLSDRPSLDELFWRPAWQARALCRGVGPATFFPPLGGSTAPAKRLCEACPVQSECEAYARLTGSAGIWAGKAQKPRHLGKIMSSGAESVRRRTDSELPN